MFGMAILAITEAAARLTPDMAPKIPQAKTVAIARPPRMWESQADAVSKRSSAKPLDEEKYAMRINMGIVVRTN